LWISDTGEDDLLPQTSSSESEGAQNIAVRRSREPSDIGTDALGEMPDISRR